MVEPCGLARGAGRTASFEHWDDLVRQPICWLAQHVANAKANHAEEAQEHPGNGLPMLADLMDAAARAFEQDPETTKLRALTEAWFAAFGPDQTTVGGAIRRGDIDALLAMDDIAGQAGKINSRMLGRWIECMQGRIVDGKRFVRIGHRAGLLHWLCINRRGTAQCLQRLRCLRPTALPMMWPRSEGAA